MDCIRPNEYKTLDRGLPTGDLLSPDALYWDFDPVKGGFKIFRANKEGTQAFPLIAGIESIEKLSAGDGLLGNDFDGVLPVEWSVDFGSGSNQVARGNHTHSFSEITGTLGLSQIQNINSNTLLGRYGAGSGAPQPIGLGTGFSVSGGTLVFNESDPTVPSYVKSITEAQISNWDSAYVNSHPALSIVGQNYITLDVGDQELTVGAINLNSSHTSGLLPVTKGGTGLTSIGTAGQLIRSNGSALEYFTHDFVSNTLIGTANGIASLDGSGKVPLSQLPTTGGTYKGEWDASTNTPTLADGVGTNGDYYRVSTGGSVNFGSGTISFNAGDAVVYNGTTWLRDPAGASLTNLAIGTRTGTTMQITNSNGNGVILPSVNSTEAGLMTSAHLLQLNALTAVSHSPASLTGGSAGYISLNSSTQEFTASLINLTSHVTGVLPIANGGTGLSSLGTAGQFLRVNASGNALEYYSLPAPTIPNLQAVTDQGATTTNNIIVYNSGGGAIQVMNSDDGSYVFNAVSPTISAIAGYHTEHSFGIGSNSSLGAAFLLFNNNTTSDEWILEYSSGLSATLGAGNQLRVQQDPVHNNDLARKLYVDTGLSTKFDIPTGTTSQYIRGDGSLATFPIIGDGTLTLAAGTGLTGSASFTANQSGNSTFTVGLGTNLSNLNALSTNGFVKKTGVNTWTIDTNTYLTNANLSGYLTEANADNRYMSTSNAYGGSSSSYTGVDLNGIVRTSTTYHSSAINHPTGFNYGHVTTFIYGDHRAQLFLASDVADAFYYRQKHHANSTYSEWRQVAARSWVNSSYVQKAGDTMTGTLNGTRIILNDQFEVVNPTAPNHKIHLVATPDYTRLNMGYGAHTTFQIHVVENGTSYFVHNIGDGSEQRMIWDSSKNITFNVANRIQVNGDVRYTGQLVSTVATGTAPMSITSTTQVNNLNADLLDGQHGSYYLSLANATGVLPITKGGTGLNTIGTAGQMLRSTGTALEFFTPSYLTGTGTAGYIPKWGTSSSLNDSAIYQDGSGRIGIGTTSMDVRLVVDGGLAVYGNTAIRPDGVGNGIFNVWRDIVVGDTVNDVHGTVFIHDGIGTPLKNSNAAFEVKSTTKGVLFPRMTAAQRDAIVGPAGMVVYNTTANAISLHNGTSWIDLASSSSFPTNYVTTNTSQTGLGGNKTWTGHHIIAPSTTSSPATVADSVRISRNANGAFMTIENDSAVSAVTLRSWNGGTGNKYQISLLTGGIETGNHGNSENWYTAWSRIDSTNLGKTGNGIIANNTTLNSEQAWSDLPIGYSAFVYSNVGTANGAPDDTYGYFTKVANRDVGGGWGGLWIDHVYNAFYVGKAHNNTTFATWSRVLTAYTPTTLSTGQLLRWNGTGWANWTPDFALASDIPTNYVTNDTNQSSLGGTKDWTNAHSWTLSSNSVPAGAAGRIAIGKVTSGVYLQAYDNDGNEAFALRAFSASGYQLSLGKGGVETATHGNSSQWNSAYTWVNTYGSGLQGGPYVPVGRTVSAGSGLYGGGALSTNISLSLSQMTSSAIGGAKLFSNTTQSVAANSVSSTAGRTYGIQLNSSGQLVVNVPWSDNNTTYTSSNGISLSGTNFSPVYGTSAGTIAQGNDSRINNGQTAYSWGNHAGLYVPIGRVVTASTGLSGGGSLATNISLSVNFGTSAGTVAQGNDSRINNGQTAYGWGNHANAGYFTSGDTIPSVGTFPMFSGTHTIGNSFLTQSGGTLYYAGNVNVSNDLTVGSSAYFNGNVNLYKSATVSENLYVNQGLYVNGSTVLMGGGGSLSCALLTLNSTTKGLVVPRMTYTQRIAITSPQNGLIVYQTNDVSGANAGFWGYEKGSWRRFHMVTP